MAKLLAVLAIVSDVAGGAGIHLAAPHGARSRVSRSETPAVVEFAPVWSPAGDRNGRSLPAVHRPGQAALGGTSLISRPTDRWPAAPSWSPDGDVVAAEWPTADRSDWVSPTPAEANDGSPAWRPTIPR